jgi:hypothetical protein
MSTPFIKISLIIFIFLALIISLFPPFEFGNEKLRTLHERNTYSDIAEKLPIKKYDFILNDNKKNIILGSYIFLQKFYNKDSLNFYKDKWSDKIFNFDSTSVDSFFTAKRVLFPFIVNKMDSDKRKKILTLLKWSNFNWKGNYEWMNDNYNKYGRFFKYNDDETDKDAINFNQVKNDYEKSPNNWDYKYLEVFDSTKKYDAFDITQPVYYLLERNLIWSELLVEYILAVLISIISGYIIQRFIPGKFLKI